MIFDDDTGEATIAGANTGDRGAGCCSDGRAGRVDDWDEVNCPMALRDRADRRYACFCVDDDDVDDM